jgi:hypothetical protein
MCKKFTKINNNKALLTFVNRVNKEMHTKAKKITPVEKQDAPGVNTRRIGRPNLQKGGSCNLIASSAFIPMKKVKSKSRGSREG